jgi:20S proteasome alpha/beta subunit
MTVCVAVKCKDGLIVASDSLATFGRGVPVLRYANKVDVLKHDGLENPVAVAAAGTIAFYDKFKRRALRTGIEAAKKQLKHKLDIIDFCDAVCEPVLTALSREYEVERSRALGYPGFRLDLSMIVAGVDKSGDLHAYFVHAPGLTEPVQDYGTIGSGAAYAELFLRYFLEQSDQVACDRGAKIAVYAIKGVELFDPHVGGKTSVKILRHASNKLNIEDFRCPRELEKAKEKMETALKHMAPEIEGLVGLRKKKRKKGAK